MIAWFYCGKHETVVQRVMLNGVWLAVSCSDACQCVGHGHGRVM